MLRLNERQKVAKLDQIILITCIFPQGTHIPRLPDAKTLDVKLVSLQFFQFRVRLEDLTSTKGPAEHAFSG